MANSALHVVGIADQPHRPPRMSAAGRVDGHQRHLAVVVDLRQPRGQPRRGSADMARRSAGAGPRRACAGPSPPGPAASSGRIGRMSQASPSLRVILVAPTRPGRAGSPAGRGSRRAGDAHHHPGVQRDHPLGVGQQRVDVQLGHLRQVDGEVREPDQHVLDRRPCPPPARRDSRASSRATRVRSIMSRASTGFSGGRPSARSASTSTADAALAEQHHRPERRRRRSRRRSAPARPAARPSAATVKPSMRGLGRVHLRPGPAWPWRPPATSASAAQIEAHAADVGLVGDVRRQDLQRARHRRSRRATCAGLGGVPARSGSRPPARRRRPSTALDSASDSSVRPSRQRGLDQRARLGPGLDRRRRSPARASPSAAPGCGDSRPGA